MKFFIIISLITLKSLQVDEDTECKATLLNSYDMEGNSNKSEITNHMCAFSGDNCCTRQNQL